MAWMTKFAIGRLAARLSKKDLKEVTIKLSRRLSVTDAKAVLIAQEPKRTVTTNADLLKNAILQISNDQNGQVTVDQLLSLLENKHGLRFSVFYRPENGTKRKSNRVL